MPRRSSDALHKIVLATCISARRTRSSMMFRRTDECIPECLVSSLLPGFFIFIKPMQPSCSLLRRCRKPKRRQECEQLEPANTDTRRPKPATRPPVADPGAFSHAHLDLPWRPQVNASAAPKRLGTHPLPLVTRLSARWRVTKRSQARPMHLVKRPWPLPT